MPNELENTLDALPPISFEEETGFVDNWRDSLGLAITEDLPITSRVIPSTTESMRKKLLYDKYEAGALPDDVWQYYVNEHGVDLDGLSDYANQYLGMKDIPTRKDYEDQRQNEYANYRKTSQETFDNQSMMGAVGQFAGTAHAMTLDPLYAVSFFTGYGGATTALQAFTRVAVAEMAVETLAQPLVMDWKDEVGAEYGAADALTNIFAAGLMGGTMSGAGKLIDIKVSDALRSIDNLGVGDRRVFAPVVNTMRNSDQNMNLRDMILRDEGLEKAMNERGSKAGVDPESGIDAGFVDRAETTFADRMVEIETYRAEARDRTLQAQGTLKGFDENLMNKLSPIQIEQSELKAFKESEKKAKTPESDVNIQVINDRLEDLNKAIEDLDLPTYTKSREALQETLDEWKDKTTEIPESKKVVERIEKELKQTEKIIEDAPTTIEDVRTMEKKVGEAYDEITKFANNWKDRGPTGETPDEILMEIKPTMDPDRVAQMEQLSRAAGLDATEKGTPNVDKVIADFREELGLPPIDPKKMALDRAGFDAKAKEDFQKWVMGEDHLEKEVSSKTQLEKGPAPTEPTNSLAKQYFAKAVDLEATIKKMEEIC